MNMKKLIICVLVSTMIFVSLGVTFMSLAAASPGVIEDFENIDDWTYSEVDATNTMAGGQSGVWKTEGSYSYRLEKELVATNNVDDYCQILRSIDLTNIDNLVFDANVTGSRTGTNKAQLIIGTDNVWENDYSPLPGVLLGITVDVSSYSGAQNVIFRLFMLNNFDLTESQLFYVDNLHGETAPLPNTAPITYDLDVGSTVDDNCVLYLNFDENSGQTENAIYDSSGENNHGDMENFNFNENSGWVVGHRGTGLLFDGDNDFVDCDNDSSLNFGSGSFSVEAWIRPSNITDAQYIVMKHNATLDVGWFFVITTGGNLYMDVYDGVNDLPLKVIVPFAENVWYHIAFTYDEDTGSLYIDGVLENSGDGSSVGDINTTTNLLIGRRDVDVTPSTFDGVIDEVRLYNRALTAGEVDNHYRKNWLALPSTDLTPRISWSYYDADADNCENVQLQIGTTVGNNDMWDYQENSNATFIDYAGLTLVAGDYYYARVRTHDGTEWGGWEDNLMFRIAVTPGIPSPLYRIILLWSESVADDNYDVQIDDDSDFSSLVIQDNNLADNSYTYTFTENGIYYWRVRTVNIDNLTSAWSGVQTVWVNTPPSSVWGIELAVVGVALALVAIALAAKRARKLLKK